MQIFNLDIWLPKLHVPWTKWCPDCPRIVPTQHKELLVLTHALNLDWSTAKITKRLGKLMHLIPQWKDQSIA